MEMVETGWGAGTDPFAMLKGDHAKVKELFVKYKEVKQEPDEKRAIAEEVIIELEAHASIEEEIFYPAVRRAAGAKGQELVAEAFEEHQVMKRLMDELDTLEPQAEEFDAKFKALSENVEHHTNEEEDEMFPIARETLGANADRVGREIKQRKQDLEAEAA
jgi:iron-sulfur cluster repair protein YtfE (RIC family)